MATPGNIQFMQTAIQLSEKAGILEKTGRCFGAVVVNGDQIVGQGYNQDVLVGSMGTSMQDRQFMQAAIQLSEQAGLADRTDCFGAVVVKEGQIIGSGKNQVISQSDPTWHAEMHAIKEACKTLGKPNLEGCILYTSCLPCPMCTAAIYWAGVDKCYYAATVEDIGRFEPPGSTGAAASSYEATVFHNREDMLPAEQRQQLPFINMMRDEGAAVFEKYSQLPESEKANADC